MKERVIKIISVIFIVSFMVSSISFAVQSEDVARIDLNQATIKELTALPGIGKKKAEAIVSFREANGKFTSIDDLKKVDGIGKDTVEKVREHVTVD